MLSSWLANFICVGFTVLYVIGFYIFKTPGYRNEPRVIKSRMKAVTVASICSALIVWLFTDDVFKALGLALPLNLTRAFYIVFGPLTLTCMLFLGPLSIQFFDKELLFQENFDFEQDVKMVFFSLTGQRNYVVGPLTEEFVFRACMISILHQADYSRSYLVFVSPLYFGLAHLHHAWESYVKSGKTKSGLKTAVLSSLFQLLYTTLFGWYASYLFIRLGNIIAPIVSHSFCNIMGFPDLSGIQDKSRFEKSIIYLCFPIGILLFIYNMNYLTNPVVVGGSMYW